MKTYTIEIAVNTVDAHEFCEWLNEQGHDATIGASTGNFMWMAGGHLQANMQTTSLLACMSRIATAKT